MISRSDFATKLATGRDRGRTTTRSANTNTTCTSKTSSKSKSKYSPSLRTLLYKRQWSDALARIASHPKEAEIQDAMGDLPLHEVCHTGGAPFQIIQRLIRAYKPALEKRGFCGRLPLHYAAYSKPSVNVIKLLLRHYPDAAKEVDDDGRLPLHLAVVRNAPKQSMQAIIDANPKALSTPNNFGSTPIMLARNDLVAELLADEESRPRNTEKKIVVVKKLVGMWADATQNPVTGKKKHSNNQPQKSTKVERLKRNVRMYKASENKKKPSKFEMRQQRSLHELQQNSLKRIGSPTAVDSPDIMSSSSSTKRSIPSPGRGAGNYRGVDVMSNYRANHLPKGIPSPQKGASNFGGAVMSKNHGRKILPSPIGLRVRKLAVAVVQ